MTLLLFGRVLARMSRRQLALDLPGHLGSWLYATATRITRRNLAMMPPREFKCAPDPEKDWKSGASMRLIAG